MRFTSSKKNETSLTSFVDEIFGTGRIVYTISLILRKHSKFYS